MPTKKAKLTAAEKKQLREYMDGLDALAENEPPHMEDILTPEQYQRIEEYFKTGKGDPPEYADRFTVTETTDADGITHRSFYDTAWAQWTAESVKLTDKYHDVIIKALLVWADENDVTQSQDVDIDESGNTISFDIENIIRFLITPQTPTIPQLPEEARNLFSQQYVPNVYSTLTEVLYNLTLKQFETDEIEDVATLTINGIEVKIEGVKAFTGDITSILKLFDAISFYLAYYNPMHIKSGARTTLEIPLAEYAAARGININPEKKNTKQEQEKENERAKKRKYAFKRDLHRDLNNLSRFRITGKITKGKHKEDYENLVLIYPDHSIENGIIKVNMPEETARLLLNSYSMYYNTALQRTNDSNPNTFRIGRYMNVHYCMDNNVAAGTNNTLKVKSLVGQTNKIPNLSELKNPNRFKDRIKDKLEREFKNLTDIGFLTKWAYRNAKTGEQYTPEQAAKLTANEYWELDVDYSLPDNKLQQKRIKEKAAEKEAAELAKAAENEKKSNKV